MSRSSVLRRRISGAVLLLAVLAAAGGLHHHDDLFGALQGTPGAATERVSSSHSPLSKAAHWHTGVSVKDEPCLACHGHRMPGLASGACAGTQPTILRFLVAIVTVAPGSTVRHSGGSRAPPALF